MKRVVQGVQTDTVWLGEVEERWTNAKTKQELLFSRIVID